MYYITVLTVIAQLILTENEQFKEEHRMKRIMKLALALGSVLIIFLIAKSKNK